MGSRNWRRGEITGEISNYLIHVTSVGHWCCNNFTRNNNNNTGSKELACKPNGARPMRLVRPLSVDSAISSKSAPQLSIVISHSNFHSNFRDLQRNIVLRTG